MKVVIVGAGIVGLATAWAVSRLGHAVVLVEQGPIPNPASASFDQHRMIRPHYGDQSGYTRMVGAAHDAWAALWQDLAVSHYAESGVLAIDLGGHEWMRASRRAFEATKTPFEVLDRSEIERLAPALSLPGDAWGLLTERAGVLFADRIVADLAAWLFRNGVSLLANSLVAHLDLAPARLALDGGAEIDADAIVVAAGAWTGLLLPGFAARVQPVRSVVGYVRPPEALRPAWAEGPALFLITAASHLYCLPPVDGTGLKFGGAPNLRAGDPDAPLKVGNEDLSQIAVAFSPYLADPEGHRMIRGAGACYADPADKRFIIERHGKAVVVTGCGGRMFKFGALVGQRIAQSLGEASRGEALATWARAEG